MKLFLACCLGVALLAGCQPQQPIRIFDKGQFPVKLSDWGIVFVAGDELILNQGVVAYDLNMPLFSDYAHKLRTIWVPEGKTGSYDPGEDISLPVGSIVSKTFYYSRRGAQLIKTVDAGADFSSLGLNMERVQLIETRILVHLEEGWQGLAYVWDKAQRDATLEITGAVLDLNLRMGGDNSQQFKYVVPDSNQCQGCHVEDLTRGEMKLLGVKVRHLNKAGLTNLKTGQGLRRSQNQLADLIERGFIAESLKSPDSLPRNVAMDDGKASLADRARSYLDINCGHCHNPRGAADTSGMFLDIAESDPLQLGICKPPVAAGQGTGGRLVGILPGDSSGSILSYRMQSLNLGAMMPELGRSLVHEEGVDLINAWINQMSGGC